MDRTIRVWHGCKVVGLLTVGDTGSSYSGGTGGAENSSKVDIEIDPWAGLLVEPDVTLSPVSWREIDGD